MKNLEESRFVLLYYYSLNATKELARFSKSMGSNGSSRGESNQKLLGLINSAADVAFMAKSIVKLNTITLL